MDKPRLRFVLSLILSQQRVLEAMYGDERGLQLAVTLHTRSFSPGSGSSEPGSRMYTCGRQRELAIITLRVRDLMIGK